MIKIGQLKDTPSQLKVYPGYGYPNESGYWRILVAGIAYQQPPLSLRQRVIIRMLGNVMQASPDQLDCDIFRDRISPFVAEADQGLKIYVRIGKAEMRLKKKTMRNGHFRSWLQIPDEIIRRQARSDQNGRRYIDYQISTDHPKTKTTGGRAHLLDRHGLSVVSDIDDTIKESEVIDKRRLLANTFLHEFRSVDGMAQVYNRWYSSGTAFHYVSSSPWQLYESLQQLQTVGGFPPGTLHLRNFRLRDQLLNQVLIIRRKGKSTAIRGLLKSMPHRDFVLIGDSGEKDPEIYRKICRHYPGRIKGIFIREIAPRPLEGERMKKLRESIPCGICAKFTSSATLLAEASHIFEG